MTLCLKPGDAVMWDDLPGVVVEVRGERVVVRTDDGVVRIVRIARAPECVRPREDCPGD